MKKLAGFLVGVFGLALAVSSNEAVAATENRLASRNIVSPLHIRNVIAALRSVARMNTPVSRSRIRSQ